MAGTNKYFQDRLILLLLSINIFLAAATALLTVARLTAGQGSTYIVQYRSSLGINAFQTGSVLELFSFIIFALLVLVVHTVLSLRVYHVRRSLSLIILSLGIMLLTLGIIVSNALLVLR